MLLKSYLKPEIAMGYLIINKDDDGMRQDMRRNMRGGYRHEGYSPMMRGYGGYEHGYKKGYEHGWEDREEEMDDMQMRRARDSRGRYI